MTQAHSASFSPPINAHLSTLPRDPEAIRRFILGGRAEFTVVNRATGGGFTYLVAAAPNLTRPELPISGWFVHQRDSGQNLRYMGMLNRRKFFTTQASDRRRDGSAIHAIDWFWTWLLSDYLHPDVDVIHKGKCGVCGRALTNPESIRRGIGPECWEKSGG